MSHAVGKGRIAALVIAAFATFTLVERLANAEASAPDDLLDLAWNAPPECPGRAAVLAQIRRALGDEHSSTATRVSAQASVSRGGDGRWHVSVVTLGESAGERTLDAASCSALTRAVSLVLAIRLRPELLVPPRSSTSLSAEIAAAPPPPPPDPPATLPMPRALPVSLGPVPAPEPAVPSIRPPSPRPGSPPTPPRVDTRVTDETRPSSRVHGSFAVGTSVVGSTGELPSADASAEIELGYQVGRFRAELHVETGLVQVADLTTPAGASVTFRAAGGGVRGCYGPTFGPVGLFGCADGEIDAIWATGHDFVETLPTTSGAWLTLGALAGGRYKLTRWLALRGSLEALAPLARPKFVTEAASTAPNGTVHKPSAAWGRAALGVEAIFF